MAGGKETPRQKMIGMMYLVLTALLALNVSKSILDAFVAIEENIQKANLTELYRGDEKRAELKLVAQDKSNPIRAKKAEKYLDVLQDIDRMTAERIALIDRVKLEILNTCGEDVTSRGEHAIITKPYDAQKEPCRPIRMNLSHVEGQDKYDDPMRIMLGDATDLKKPTGLGMEIWNSVLSYRKELTEMIATTRLIVGKDEQLRFDPQFNFKAPEINEFSGPSDLDKKIKIAIKAAKVHPDDAALILEIYRDLSKEEYSTVQDIPGVHWLGKTFDHAPVVAALASLSSLQNDILAARAEAIGHIRGRIGGGDYSFNSVLPLAYGPEVVNQNEDVSLEVLMAVYDSDKQPRVTFEGNEITDVRNGKAFINVKATNGTMNLKGTVAIQKNDGTWSEREWQKTVTVMKPSGSIELIEMNTLYRGYPNRIQATASGYPETIVTATNATVTRSGDGYVVSPGSGGKAYINVSGRTADGKTVSLKRSEYTVRRLPKASLYWGGVEASGKASSSRLLIAKYPPEIPLNATFQVLSWSCTYAQMRGGPITGAGGDLTPLTSTYNLATSGTVFNFTVKVRRPDGVTETLGAFWVK